MQCLDLALGVAVWALRLKHDQTIRLLVLLVRHIVMGLVSNSLECGSSLPLLDPSLLGSTVLSAHYPLCKQSSVSLLVLRP